MKREVFIALVCKRLDELGTPKAEIEKQRVHIKKYLESLGIGDVSGDLDGEDPVAFAEEIFEIIKVHGLENKEDTEPMGEEKNEEENFEDGGNEDEDEDEDVKVFYAPSDAKDDDSDSFEDLGDELEAENAYEDFAPEDGTREFNISDMDSEASFDEDETEDEDEYYQAKPTGNPVFFWILTVILSPLWVPVAALLGVLVIALYILLSVFIVLYVPLLILMILGGSVGIIAELIYSIVKFVTGEIHIGLFELGLGFALAAAVISLSVLIYRFGTKYAPNIWSGYFENVSRLLKKLRKVVRKLREVCSI